LEFSTSHFLKVSSTSLPSSLKLKSKPLTHGPLGDIQIQTAGVEDQKWEARLSCSSFVNCPGYSDSFFSSLSLSLSFSVILSWR
jgi:hypothetical protein